MLPMTKGLAVRGGRGAALLFTGVLLLLPPAAGALEGLAPGQRPPAFVLSDLNGKRISSDYLSGAPGAILFWSTWSPRSAELLADFREYFRDYGSRGLKILAVNIDGAELDRAREEAVKAYAPGKNLPFPVLFDEGLATYAAYGVMAHPSSVIIDRDGRVAYSLGGYPPSLRDELQNRLRRVLGLPVEEVQAEPTVAPGPAGGARQYYRQGLRLLEKRQMERALDTFRKAADLDPTFIEPSIMAARLSLAAGDAEEAASLLRRADAAAVNRDDLRFLTGMVLLQEKNIDAARKVFEALKEMSPDGGFGDWGLGLALLAGGEAEGVLTAMRAGAEAVPPGPEIEAFVRERLLARWKQGLSYGDESGLVELFPSLSMVRNRYLRMYGVDAFPAR